MVVTFEGKRYEFMVKDVLESLTGHESIEVEDFLGGWDKFRQPSTVARSTVVMVWLAKRSAGEKVTFDEVASTPGLLFGDAWQVEDDEQDDGDGQSPLSDTPQTTTVPKPSEHVDGRTLALTNLRGSGS